MITLESIAARALRLRALADGLTRELIACRRRGPGLLTYEEAQAYRNGVHDAAAAAERAAAALNRALLRIGEERFDGAA